MDDDWVVLVELALGRDVDASDIVPSRSMWYAVIPSTYPIGEVKVYPAKTGGVTATFPHQDRNDHGERGVPWRTGKLCLQRATTMLGSPTAGRAPPSAEDRLAWYMKRALAWLDAAAKDCLISAGDPYELPQVVVASEFRVVHDESKDSFDLWRQAAAFSGAQWGSLELARIPGPENTLLASVFRDSDGNTIRQALQAGLSQEKWSGYWWIWPSQIVIPPWRAPTTWGELRTAGRHQRVNVYGVLRQIVQHSKAHVAPLLLLGFPIPRMMGEDAEEIHWQAVRLPGSGARPKIPNGFRDNPVGRWQALLQAEMRADGPLPLMLTANWHPDRTQARGRLHVNIRSSSIAIVGVGALGSAVAELLVRQGVGKMVLIDGDTVEIGNLVRHSLDTSHLGRNKAEAVAERLRLASPMAHVGAVPNKLAHDLAYADLLSDVDIIIDCTAEDSVVTALSTAWSPRPKLFVSASVGSEAKRLFAFTAIKASFPVAQFLDEIGPWLEREREAMNAAGETLEGPGCWSPLFPARLDALWMAAGEVVRLVERTMTVGVDDGLHVFDCGAGLSRLPPPQD